MKSRRKSWNSTINSLLLLTSIAAISFMGVSYAIFTNNVEITTSISTAKINPIFCSKYYLEDKYGNSNLVIKLADDNHTLRITGEVTTQSNNGNGKNKPGYEASLHYCIKNDGTVPIKFIGDKSTIQSKINGSNNTLVKLKDSKDNASLEYEIDIPSDAGKSKFKLTINQQKGILNGGDSFYSETGNPKLNIETTEPGEYNFEVELPFILWNGSPVNYKSWKETLIIKGDITVKEAIEVPNNIDIVTADAPAKDSSNK